MDFMVTEAMEMSGRHLEVVFKPKKFFVPAFSELNNLLELMRKIGTGFACFKDICMESVDLGTLRQMIASINLTTGKIDYKYLFDSMLSDGDVDPEEFAKNPDLKKLDFMSYDLFPLKISEEDQVDRICTCVESYLMTNELQDTIVDKDGNIKLVFPCYDLARYHLGDLGIIIGTFAEKLIGIKYYSLPLGVNSTVKEECQCEDIKFKVFSKGDTMQNDLLVVKDMPVTRDNTMDIRVDLVNLSNLYDMRVKIELPMVAKDYVMTNFEMLEDIEKMAASGELPGMENLDCSYQKLKCINDVLYNLYTACGYYEIWEDMEGRELTEKFLEIAKEKKWYPLVRELGLDPMNTPSLSVLNNRLVKPVKFEIKDNNSENNSFDLRMEFSAKNIDLVRLLDNINNIKVLVGDLGTEVMWQAVRE